MKQLKILIFTIFFTFIFSLQVFADDSVPIIYTFKNYDANNEYSETGGTTMAASGVSTMTWTAGGSYSNNVDHRTIDLRSLKLSGSKIFVVSLMSSEVANPENGVSVARTYTWKTGVYSGAAAADCGIRLQTSVVDGTTYWAGASYYYVPFTSGTSRVQKVINYTSSDVSTTTSILPLQRYIRLQFVSGVSALRNPYVTMAIWPFK
jgi:hypothetical protein